VARTGNGTSGYVKSASFTGPTRFTFHFWYRNAATPDSGATRTVLNLTDNAASGYDMGFSWDHTSASFRQAVYMAQADYTFQAAKLTTAVAADTWYAIAGLYDGTTLEAYLAGTREAQTAATDPDSGTTTKLTALAAYWGTEGGSPQYDQGTIAEVALWDAALSAAELLALAGGVSPRTLRRDNLLLYWPLWGLDTTEPDLSANNRTGAVTDTTFHPHAPVPPTFFARPRSVSQTAPYQPAAVLQNYRRRRAA